MSLFLGLKYHAVCLDFLPQKGKNNDLKTGMVKDFTVMKLNIHRTYTASKYKSVQNQWGFLLSDEI